MPALQFRDRNVQTLSRRFLHMRRVIRSTGFAALLATALSAALIPAVSAASTKPVVTKVTVIAKEFSFKLSKQRVPTGTVVFTVKNEGKTQHNFSIAGKTTPLINPGKSAMLKVTFKKKGAYKYSCTVPGHAKLGMKGTLGVNVTPPKTTTAPTTTTPTTTQPAGNVASTIDVSMFEYGFTLTENGQPVTSVPSGPVTFVVTNNGQEVHNFDIETIHAGAFLNPGQSETWTVTLAPRSYSYECDVAYHAQYGMIGTLSVTPDP
jgi:uncharacterized cupredoxin-like copper-binding protein